MTLPRPYNIKMFWSYSSLKQIRDSGTFLYLKFSNKISPETTMLKKNSKESRPLWRGDTTLLLS